MCQGSYSDSIEPVLSLPSFKFFPWWEIWEWKWKNRKRSSLKGEMVAQESVYRLIVELNAHSRTEMSRHCPISPSLLPMPTNINPYIKTESSGQSIQCQNSKDTGNPLVLSYYK